MAKAVTALVQGALTVVLGGALAACSGTPVSPTCNAVYFYPNVQLVYPIPGATNVPDTLSVLLYNTSPNVMTLSSVPIALGVGASASLATTAIPLPNPAPSPTASPAATPFTTAAVALPRLSAATTYQVFATQSEGGCVPSGKTQVTNIGSFTTQ